MNKNEKIVVCGAGGFIGGHLIADLRRQGFANLRAVDVKPLSEWYQRFPDVENLVLNLQEREACYRAFHEPPLTPSLSPRPTRGEGVRRTGEGHIEWFMVAMRARTRVETLQEASYVYNLAADMGGMGFIENNRALCMLSVLINTHLLMAARDIGVERFFYSSSACVYNAEKQKSPEVTPLREEDAYPAMPEDGYGWEKLFSERMCRHFREDFGIQTRVARYHNVYGPHGTYDGGREKAPAAICRKVIQAKLSGKHEIEIWGDGTRTRSFNVYRRLPERHSIDHE